MGLLGARHPGLFAVGDTRALRALLLRAERERTFYDRLAQASLRLAPRFAPAAEREAWRRLLAELGVESSRPGASRGAASRPW